MYTHMYTKYMSDKMAHYEASMNSTAAFIQDRTGQHTRSYVCILYVHVYACTHVCPIYVSTYTLENEASD